jgi:AcrR family transcriptional regulator
MTTRKQELLDRLLAYLLRRGPVGLSLRPMAAEVGTSARLLIFHFGSREKLLREVLGELQRRFQASFAALRAHPHGRGPLLKSLWAWALEKENFDRLRLLYAIHILAVQEPRLYGRSLRRTSRTWLELVQEALPRTRRNRAFATLVTAVFDGLFLEVMTTGDRRRTTAALEAFLRLFAGPREVPARRRVGKAA